MALRTTALLFLLVLFSFASCSHGQPVQILSAPPPEAYHTLGMVAGQGENPSSALDAMVQQAGRIEADAVIVVSERPVGGVIVMTGRAIRFLPPPGR